MTASIIVLIIGLIAIAVISVLFVKHEIKDKKKKTVT